MPLLSMTGYGSATAEGGHLRVEVELMSVNRKQFDCRLTLPRSVLSLEPRTRKFLQGRVTRGMLSCSVRMTLSGKLRARGINVDPEMASKYVSMLKKAARAAGVPADISMELIANLPDVVNIRQEAVDAEKVWRVMKGALAEACDRMLAMRRNEGASLQKDIAARLQMLEKEVQKVKGKAPGVLRQYQAALKKRLSQLGVKMTSADPILLRELAVFADRCDISEELIRLDSHLQQANRLLALNGPSGRTFDFLCQEMFREINTIGSKANSAAISRIVVRFKTQLESLREQVQNIE